MSWMLRMGRTTLDTTRHMLRGGGPPRITLGVRAAVFDGGQVLLVRHTYMPGWHLPGGAIDRGESAATAAARELREETWVEVSDAGRLIGFYFNPTKTKSDHIALFVFDQWSAPRGLATPNMEIAEARFFPSDALPDGTTKGTRLRLGEIAGAPLSPMWSG